MTIHEFGAENKSVFVLIHPSLVRWDYFEFVVPLLAERHRVIVPALPGYDPDREGDFTSVEEIASELADQLAAMGVRRIDCLYGCSMGGSVALRFLAEGRLPVRAAAIDGGITPYQLPRPVTRLIAIRDFLMISLGKLGGAKLLEKAFSTDEYSEEDLHYVEDVLRHMSRKTIWRTFESCNNYAMPDPVKTDCGRIEYWYADAEAKARKWDIAYMRKRLPQAAIRRLENVGHGGLAALQPRRLAGLLEVLCK